jgi:hypothetical protein
MSPTEFDSIMHEVGRGAMAGRAVPRGSLRDRVITASSLLNELGGLSEVEEEMDSTSFEATAALLLLQRGAPGACNALESLLREFVGTRVTKCGDRYDRVRCCIEVAQDSGSQLEIQH